MVITNYDKQKEMRALAHVIRHFFKKNFNRSTRLNNNSNRRKKK